MFRTTTGAKGEDLDPVQHIKAHSYLLLTVQDGTSAVAPRFYMLFCPSEYGLQLPIVHPVL